MRPSRTPCRPCWRCSSPAGRQSVPGSSIPAAPPAHPRGAQARAAARKPGAARCSWSLRTCTGSTPRPRPCSTAGREPADRPAAAPGQLPPGVSARLGQQDLLHATAARPAARRRAPTSCSQALLGDEPSLVPLTRLLIARTEGNPFFLEESVRTLVETGVLVGERGAYRLAQAARHVAGARHGAGGAGGAHRPPAAGGETAAADRRRHRHRGALAAAAGHCRAARGRAAPWPRAPAGGRVPLRDAPVPRARSTPSSTP